MEQEIRLKSFSGKVITIDGPAGSGKSTTAREIARRIGFAYLDTGAMYRTAAWLALEREANLSDGDQLKAILAELAAKLRFSDDWSRITLGDREITAAIRTPEVDVKVSEVAAIPAARLFMVEWQRRLAEHGSVVLEGRDTGTVVWPRAELKVYLDAHLETRAGRRVLDYSRRGIPADVGKMVVELERRDNADLNRKHGPLKKANDAVIVDTTDMTIEEQIEAIMRLCRVKLGPG